MLHLSRVKLIPRRNGHPLCYNVSSAVENPKYNSCSLVNFTVTSFRPSVLAFSTAETIMSVLMWVIYMTYLTYYNSWPLDLTVIVQKNKPFVNLFTTIHDGNFRRHSSMNVTRKWHKFSSNIYYIYVFLSFDAGNCVSNSSFKWRKIELLHQYICLDPGMHPGLEVKGLKVG